MRIAHLPDGLSQLRDATPEDPLRVLVSGCLKGLPCGVEGSDYGLGAVLAPLFAVATLRIIPFCPEDFGMGTPRTMPDIHGGDGYDVLDGRARVLDEHGTDLTEKMLAGAREMHRIAERERVELAILTDMSAACGTQVISDGCRLVPVRRFRASVGVAAALLVRHGVPVVSQRDPRTLGLLRKKLDPTFCPDESAVDYHDVPWYRQTFGDKTP